MLCGSRSRLAVRAGAWSECEPARVGEAETCVARRAFGEHGGKDASPFIEVVVDLSRGLVLMRAQDPADVLGQAALIGDRRGEEQGIQGRAVEAFASVGAGGHDQERWPAGLWLQAGLRRGAALGAHPAAEDNRAMPGLAQPTGEPFQLAGPIGEDQAVAVLAKCGKDVQDDLPGALLIGGQVPVDGRHAARARRIGVTVVPVRGRVHVQHGGGPAGAHQCVLAGCVAG